MHIGCKYGVKYNDNINQLRKLTGVQSKPPFTTNHSSNIGDIYMKELQDLEASINHLVNGFKDFSITFRGL